jgi:3-(3-hydroxy-phenyl)propionate hydroxylase
LLVWGEVPAWASALPLKTVALAGQNDPTGLLARRYDLRVGTAVLLRPDQHVAARWRAPTEASVRAALARVTLTDAATE